MTKVITYQAPNGATIDLSVRQVAEFERRGVWPRNENGEEFCTVSHDWHDGAPHVECFSDTGWSLHPPGSTDDEIASGDAPALYSGPWN